ncbi:MAG: OadG family protein [Anaerolineae bacterium]|nr:OadG family protein [Anaerolineae bacterium]
MDSPVTISLVVSGIGMLMLFLALAILYGLMYLMTALIKDRPEAGIGGQGSRGAEEQEAVRRGQEAGSRKRQAAVIAVALARAEQELSPIGALGVEGAEEEISAWRMLHHQRQLTLNNIRARRVR